MIKRFFFDSQASKNFGVNRLLNVLFEILYLELLKLDFKFFNMWTQGIWLVDPQHSMFEVIKKTAIEVAKTAGDLKTYNELINS